MSRTYRIRNLPRLTAKKYVDGKGGWNYRRRDQRLTELRQKYYPEYGEKPSWNSAYYHVVYDIERKLEREFPNPAEPVYSHPWVSWSRIGGPKTYYKRHGNRNARRRVKVIVKSMPLDEEYDNNPRHKMPSCVQEVWDIWNVS